MEVAIGGYDHTLIDKACVLLCSPGPCHMSNLRKGLVALSILEV